MFESIANGISEFFSDVMPHTFCVGCFLKGFLEGAALGLVALAAIAAAPAWLAIGLTVGLVALGAYGMAQLAHNWDHMGDGAKSEALGNLAGGIVAGFSGPKIMPGSIPFPGVRMLATPEGVLVPVLVVEDVAISATAGQSAAAGLGGSGLAMMSGEGDSGSNGGSESESKGSSEPNPQEGNGERAYRPTPKHEKGGWGTEMDLQPEEAQQVLDGGIKGNNGKQVYGYKDGKIYEFQPDNAGGYHGYPVKGNEVPPEVLRQMKNDGTISAAEYGKLRKGKQ